MMVASQYDRSSKLALADGIVESQGNPGAPLTIRVQDTGLGADHKIILCSLFYPMYVVIHLSPYFLRGIFSYFPKHPCSDCIGLGKVFRILGHADPAERPESIVEEKRSHYVLHI